MKPGAFILYPIAWDEADTRESRAGSGERFLVIPPEVLDPAMPETTGMEVIMRWTKYFQLISFQPLLFGTKPGLASELEGEAVASRVWARAFS